MSKNALKKSILLIVVSFILENIKKNEYMEKVSIFSVHENKEKKILSPYIVVKD